MGLFTRAARSLLALALTMLLGGLCAATLMRFAPGFGLDERELDPRFGSATLRAIRESRSAEQNTIRFYAHYLTGLAHADLGVSQSSGRPVKELLADRIPPTAQAVGLGLLAGWGAGLPLAIGAAALKIRGIDITAGGVSAVALCLPSSVLALLLFLCSGSRRSVAAFAAAAVCLAVFPRVFRYGRGVLAQAADLPHVLMARARGLGTVRTLAAHIFPGAMGPIFALAGVSVSVALSAVIPIEV